MGDSGEDCARALGGGCGWIVEDPEAPCETERGSTDSGTSVDSGEVEGQGICGVASGSLEAVLLALVVLARRARWLVVLGIVGVGAARAGVDANHVATLDGGDFTALREAEAGAPWTPAAAMAVGWSRGNVDLVVSDQRDSLLGELLVVETGVSFRVADIARVGVALSNHRWLSYEGHGYDDIPGDVQVWLQTPILEGDSAVQVSWWVQVDVPRGGSDYWVGDAPGSVRGMAAFGTTRGEWQVLGNLGAKLSKLEPIPGQLWGNRLEAGLGVQRGIAGPVGATVELFGSVPLGGTGFVDGSVPVETLATLDLSIGSWGRLRAGAGGGLSHGVGSPSLRTLLMVDLRKRALIDRDGDGIVDLRDRCVNIPEDRDHIEDVDGCPEDDADGDLVLDPADPCPLHPETRNGYQDGDGCPDEVTSIVLTVTSADPELPVESARAALGEEAPFGVLAGEPIEVRQPTGPVAVGVTAEGFHPWERTIELESGDRREVSAELEPIRFGEVALRLVEADGGAPLAGFVRRGGTLRPVPAEGLVLDEIAGPVRLDVSAVGHGAGSGVGTVPAGGRVEVVVPLKPSALRIVGTRIETGQEVPFALDADRITDDALLDEIAALLAADPRIRLLRIEGHADELGTSAYNLDLSRRRAVAVRERLIQKGVAPERLEAIGTGEARPASGGASRRVEFLVLVWGDE